MCGIVGIIARGSPRNLGQHGWTMLECLTHRGPDDHGWLSYSRDQVRHGQGDPGDLPAEVLLLHRRLSILDLSPAGRQPMSSRDGRYHVVFNGEIYNYLELRDELAAVGFTFSTGTDTEVLLAALSHWGLEALPRLVGMFAIALLDTQVRKITLARDFCGIKPLFYTVTPDYFAFASEIKSLIRLPGVPRRANLAAVYRYLRFGIADHTPGTFLEDIKRVPPACYIEMPLDDPAAAEPRPYWRIDPHHTAEISFDEAARKLRELFLDSVRLHLRSDVPVGTALSGGVDSSSIVMAVREVAGRQSDFHTFSFVASGSADDEEQWVDIVTAAAGTTAHKVQIAAAELVHDLDDLIIVQDEPFVSTSIYAQYQVFRLAHRHGIKVLLDGQGADEMLAGYRGYLISRLWTLLRQSRLREAFAFGRRAAKQPGVGLRCLLRATCGQGLPNWLFAAVKPLVSKERWLDQRWFARRGVDIITHGAPPSCSSLRANLVDTFSSSILPSLLRYEDRNSMAFSIESRVPFLTPRIAEFLFSLPEAYLIDGDGTSKHVFRAAMRGIVPDAILDRRDKIGFATPELRWLRTIRPWVDHVLNSEAARAIPVLRPQVVIDQWNAMYWGSQKFDRRVWRSLNLIRWSEHLGIQF